MLYGKIVEKFNLEGKEVIFRYPKPEDLDGHLELINSLVKEKAIIHIQKRQSRKEESKWFSNRLKRIKEKSVVEFVVEIDGEVTGEADIRKCEEAREHVGELGIFLRKEIRGKGVGKRLVKQLLKEAKNVLKVIIVKLTAFGLNKIALNFYKNLGFKEVGRIKKGRKYYGKYDDDVIMVKYL